MTWLIRAFLCVALMALGLPAGGFAGDTGAAANKPAAAKKPRNPAGTTAKRGSPSAGESVKPAPQEEVHTRGLLSKKKKKSAGGAAGHTESPDLGDLPAQSESGAGK